MFWEHTRYIHIFFAFWHYVVKQNINRETNLYNEKIIYGVQHNDCNKGLLYTKILMDIQFCAEISEANTGKMVKLQITSLIRKHTNSRFNILALIRILLLLRFQLLQHWV